MQDRGKEKPIGWGIAFVLVYFSGFAALVYQVLWMEKLGLLFGNTSYATGVTLASFFAGLAVGSRVLGRRVADRGNPLRTYAWLEAAIALSGLLYFWVPSLFESLYPPLYRSLGASGWLVLVKLVLSVVLVLPPSFCMGGTIPVIGEALIRRRETFGTTAALVYGVNTLGAATGAILAGFYLPLWLGFSGTALVAMTVSGGVAVLAYRASQKTASRQGPPALAGETAGGKVPLTRQQRRQRERDQTRPAPERRIQAASGPTGQRRLILFLCFLSGFAVLALEVVWTRMFSQVFENSVYTFAAILVVVLFSLALGALLSSALARLSAPPTLVLAILLVAGAAAIMVTPALFLRVTEGMQLVFSAGSWSSYLLLIFRTVALTVMPAAVILGTIFPYLMKIEEVGMTSPGRSLGRLACANTLGAIAGSLLCGFFLLDTLGLWRSLQVIAVIDLAAALALPIGWDSRSLALKFAGLGVLFVNLFILTPRDLPVVSTDPAVGPEKVIETWEGSACTVAVTESPRLGTTIRINSHYSLGSSGAYPQEKFQADLPLMVFPETRRLFFLGVGTGITAGAALDPRHPKVERVVACELEADVITAARTYFTDLTGGLFQDPRAEILVEDGRHHLMATAEHFDLINADLFVPFRSGAGSLYTREHFENARERLTPGGVFVQWLPLYQLTETEFFIIARTMLKVFDQVSLWRHNFQPGDEILALMGHPKGQRLPASVPHDHADRLLAVAGKNEDDLARLQLPLNSETILLFYGGNLSAARSLFAGAPVNTDDHPVIEYLAPRSYRAAGVEGTPWLVGAPLAALIDEVQEICPPSQDPLLADRRPVNRRLSLAGSALHRARIAQSEGRAGERREGWEEFLREWTREALPND